MDARDAKALYEIKQKYGGTIKPISNAYAVRYKLVGCRLTPAIKRFNFINK